METKVLIRSAPKTLCSLCPTPLMLPIKFEEAWPTGCRDIQVWMCGRRTDHGLLLLCMPRDAKQLQNFQSAPHNHLRFLHNQMMKSRLTQLSFLKFPIWHHAEAGTRRTTWELKQVGVSKFVDLSKKLPHSMQQNVWFWVYCILKCIYIW